MTKAVPPGFCCAQEASGRHGAGEDVLLLDVDAHAGEFGHYVAASPLTVIGKEAKRNVPLPKLANKVVRTRYEFRAPVEHTVHVDKITVLQRKPLYRFMIRQDASRLSSRASDTR